MRKNNNSIGKIQRGPNFSELKKSPSPPKQVNGRDLFNFKMVAKIGPQDYDPVKVHKKARQTVIVKNSYTPEPMHTTASGNLISHTDQPITENDMAVNMIQFPQTLDDVAPFTIDKRDAIYKSSIKRDPLGPSKDKSVSPGPGSYNPTKPERPTLVVREKTNFGSNTERESLLHRDITQMPFGDPTNLKNPSPQKYQKNEKMMTKKNQILSKLGSSLGIPEMNMSTSFMT